MDLSNRSVGIICATLLVGIIAVRIQSDQRPTIYGAAVNAPTDPPSASRTYSSTGTKLTPSELRAIKYPSYNLGPISGNNPITVEDQTSPYDYSPADGQANDGAAYTAPAYSDGTDNSDDAGSADDAPMYSAPALTDDPSEYYAGPNNQGPGTISDGEMLNQMMATMDPDQQRDFRATWVTMSPDERQDFLDQMRGGN